MTFDSVTCQLVRFAHELTIDRVPEPILHKLKLHLLDALGCGWAASGTAAASLARDAAGLLGGHGNCHVFGVRRQYSAPAAAFANAMLINGLDHDDGVEIDGKGLGHPGATLVSAAMAALDQSPCVVEGQVLLSALAAGFEVNNRLIHALQPSAERFAQVYGVAQHQAIGAAVVGGRILGLSDDLLGQAVGLAAAFTCLPSLHKYNWHARPLVTLKDGVASAAQAGVQAALLAQLGFVGSRDVFDGPQGYWRMIGSDRFDPEVLMRGLGEQWYIGHGSFKRYPACRWLACALECMETIVRNTGWQAEEIDEIEVRTFARLAEDFMDMAPGSPADAQFSLPYTLATVALRLFPGADWYAEEIMRDARVRDVMSKVRAVVDPFFEQRMGGPGRQPGARVTVRHRDGQAVTQELSVPLGSSARPMNEAEIVAKACGNMSAKVARPREWAESMLGDARWHGHLRSSVELVG
ncbi:MmgE/PrpD family protein [Pseudothauera nasutitermitis]|uniref:MmgE/PrpD family protein n=1 Tax=Pseudothauera nasutitermitis TaxID=2565930 RepID=A0A4S4B0T9_9RHOO|nr:MmgE/PrpD family protein [Pseudothauera nasutitermitis]THF65652.1 MmgE/PrpD family protein [Pseudothauera nasutitermitis]